MRHEIARALKVLGEAHAKLDADGGLVLTSPGDADMVVPAAVVSAMIGEGLLVRARDEVRRTAAGRSFLRRALATGGEDGFVAQHRVTEEKTVEVDGVRTQVQANTAESPLAWLATRKGRGGEPLIDALQRAAGERLARDFERGHGRERTTQVWDASGVRGGGKRDRLTTSEAALSARMRVESALQAVGAGLAEILLALCCEEVGLEAAEKRLGLPARSGKVLLRLGLDRLAQHYGMGRNAIGSGRGFVHWGAEGYRPSA